jgi:hypothetical protein
MKKNSFWVAMFSMALALGMALVGCTTYKEDITWELNHNNLDGAKNILRNTSAELKSAILASVCVSSGGLKLQGFNYTNNTREMILFLIENGVDINEPLRGGVYGSGYGTEYTYRYIDTTPLMVAAANGNFEAVKVLVEKGAKVNLRDRNGATAASLAYDGGEIEIYNYLKEHGAIEFEQKQSSAPAASQGQAAGSGPASQSFFVTVWYESNGTRMSAPMAITASSKDAAEREAERQWKTINGWNTNVKFLEAVANW